MASIAVSANFMGAPSVRSVTCCRLDIPRVTCAQLLQCIHRPNVPSQCLSPTCDRSLKRLFTPLSYTTVRMLSFRHARCPQLAALFPYPALGSDTCSAPPSQCPCPTRASHSPVCSNLSCSSMSTWSKQRNFINVASS